MIRRNLLQPELIGNFVPVAERERRQKTNRFLLYSICFFVAGVAVAWIVTVVEKRSANTVSEEEQQQL